MATARVKLVRNTLPAISPTLWSMLRDAELPPDFDKWQHFSGISAELWTAFRDAVMSEWLVSHPGRRPSCWWRFDAPEARRRIAGVGRPDFEVYAYQPSYKLGIPDGWADDFDPSDAPTFESQSTFLKRLGLLVPGELKRLKKADFLPETVVIPTSLEIDIET